MTWSFRLADIRGIPLKVEEASERVAAVFEGRRYLGLVGLDGIHEAEAILAFVRLRERASASGLVAVPPVLQRHSETGA
jgi:hypothetical protein